MYPLVMLHLMKQEKRINNLYPNKEIIISTLHSLGTRELGINTTTQLLQGSNWKAFKKLFSDMSGPRI
jgi:hypothetical protein